MKKILFLSPVLIVFIAVTGCKKENTPAKPSCKINQITETNMNNQISTFTIAYNATGKISTVSFAGTSISYNYGANSIVLIAQFNNSGTVTATYTPGSDGKPVNLHEVFSNNSDWENVSYEYSNGELSKATYTASYLLNPADDYFSWQNGNLTTLVDTRNQDTTTYTISYYTDKLYQQGDYIFYSALTGDGEIIPFLFLPELVTTNLIKSFVTKYEKADISYNFDTAGKITSMNVESTRSQKTSVSYQYDCH